MKRLVLTLLLPLLSFACEGDDPDSDLMTTVSALSVSGAAVDATSTVRTHLGVESRTPAAALPRVSPNPKMSQVRWEALRAGTKAPESTWEREALGMPIIACASAEWCDVANCNGVDLDAVNAEGYDEKEHQIAPDANYGLGFDNCDILQAPGGALPPFRCSYAGGGGRGYSGCWGAGCPTVSTLTIGDLHLFSDQDFSGICAHKGVTGSLSVSDMASIATGNALKDKMTSFRFGGTGTGTQNWEFWDWSGFPIWSTSWSGTGALEQPNVGTCCGFNDRAAALKVGHAF